MYYLTPFRDGYILKSDSDVYVLLDGSHIHPDKIKQWCIEVHCQNGHLCVACSKWEHNIKFAHQLLYILYDAKTNTLSQTSNYKPFTGLSYRAKIGDDLISLPNKFSLPLCVGMLLSFNLPERKCGKRFTYPMDFVVGSFQDTVETIGNGVENEITEDDGDDMDNDNDGNIDMFIDEEEEEEENKNHSLILLSDGDEHDNVFALLPPLPPNTPRNVKEYASIPIKDSPRPPPIISEAARISIKESPPPVIPEVDDQPFIIVNDLLVTPQRSLDPSGITPLNISSPIRGLCAIPSLASSPNGKKEIADLRAELEETQAQLQVSIARNAFLSPFGRGYQSLNSPK